MLRRNLSAADLSLGAFVTAAINDREVEQALGLDSLIEGSAAIFGFGPRHNSVDVLELVDLQPACVARDLGRPTEGIPGLRAPSDSRWARQLHQTGRNGERP